MEDNKYDGYWSLAEKEGADGSVCYYSLDINGSTMEAWGMDDKGFIEDEGTVGHLKWEEGETYAFTANGETEQLTFRFRDEDEIHVYVTRSSNQAECLYVAMR
ncbi:hypothetical protein IC620_09510 [Hazenella sp. IB182357]|uniref:Lipocalin-like domain-containing protein n=1 Tax=Polycladospora coralii TaxID=2771432 RepID=A0A926NBZ7_9BACL|nr:hypothetical protein [Polycladospora coralii]